MIRKSLLVLMVLSFVFYFNELFSEVVPAIYKPVYPIGKGFLFMGGGSAPAAFGETQKEGCMQGAAYGYPINWERPTPELEYACYSTTMPGAILEGTACIFCSDGNYRKERCDFSLGCPDDSWALIPSPNGAETVCYRSNDYCWKDLDHTPEEQLIAAIVYGEASTDDDIYEMYAIASATINMVNAHLKHPRYLKYDTLIEFFKSKRYHDYSKALLNGNVRFKLVMCTENTDGRFDKAYQAAKNALSGGQDYSNGACWWDGYDLKTEGSKHYRYKSPRGFHFSLPEHNLFSIEEPPPYNKKGNKGKIYNYVFESTAAYGKSIFWKYSDNFIKVTGTPACA